MGTVDKPQIGAPRSLTNHKKAIRAREYVGRAADYMLTDNSSAALAAVIAAVDKLVDIAEGRE